MVRFVAVLVMGLFALPIPFRASVGPSSLQQSENQSGQVLNVPNRRRRARGDVHRRKNSGIGGAFSEAGRSAGRGGKRFGKHFARGRPARGGKELGKGMGGFGKNFGKGMARVGKRIAKP
jgi:hypothetical protein